MVGWCSMGTSVMTHGVPFLYDLAWRLRPGVVMGLKVSPIALPQTVAWWQVKGGYISGDWTPKKQRNSDKKYQELTENQQKSHSPELSAMFSKYCDPSMKLSLDCETGLHKMLNWLGLSLRNAQGSLHRCVAKWLLYLKRNVLPFISVSIPCIVNYNIPRTRSLFTNKRSHNKNMHLI